MTSNGAAGAFDVRGRLTFDTAPTLLAESASWFADAPTLTINLAGVTLADSAGVALLLEWLQRARTARRELVYSGFPEQVRRLIDVSGLNEVFGLDPV